uniref:Uncharacterized protein n=1 Tax=viral metagenome TaxID=1070528 RepID=A0A6C0EFL5_9ZZZZ
MSSTRLVLTNFPNDETKNKNKYELFEKDFIPQEGVPYFIYYNWNGKTPNNVIDNKNINLIKHIFGFAKASKGNHSISDTQKNNINNDEKFNKSFTNKRTAEIDLMYEKLSNIILSMLHDITWNTFKEEVYYDQQKLSFKSNDKYVLSSLDWEEFIPLINKVKDIFEIVYTKIINDKYNIKYSSIEVEQAVEKVKLETDQMIGKKMNKKK